MEMSNGEICARFKQAKDRNEQIGILAELNDCGTAEIMKILADGGCISGLPKAKAAKKDKMEWTAETDRELIKWHEAGLGTLEIAERMGLDRQQVQNRKSKLRKKGYIFDVVRSEGCGGKPASAAGQTIEREPAGNKEEAERQQRPSCGMESLAAAIIGMLPGGVEFVSAGASFKDAAGGIWDIRLSRQEKI